MNVWTAESLKAIRKPKDATHIRLTSPEGRSSVQIWKDKDHAFVGCYGYIEAGRMRKAEKKGAFFSVIGKKVNAPAPAPKEEPKADPAPKAEKTPKAKPAPKKAKVEKIDPDPKTGPSKCEFIDALFLEGKSTIDEIHAATMKAFPDSDAEKTLATVRCRPSHIRKAGGEPKWIKTRKGKLSPQPAAA